SELIQQAYDCGKLYLANKCSPPEYRLPALQAVCSDWELCMTHDPHEIGRLKVGADAVAEVLNRLFEPLSLKTMVCFVPLSSYTFC
ncbi:Brl1/Brr6 domain-containing protein, partial [Chytriomyces sp. MP71]